MELYLGVDGGGTGCRAAVAGADGPALGTGEAGPANIFSDPDGARGNIVLAARRALAAAGLPEDALAGLRAGLGLAGANAGGAVERLLPALPFRARVETDAVAAAMGALRGADGIVAALGTGSVFAVQRDGVVRQVGGWGLALGDEGSGAWIGRAALARALRAVDGLAAPTPLLDALVAEHGGPAGVVAFAGAARPVEFGAIARRIVGSDDPAAAAVMERATADVAEVVARLQAGGTVPVTWLGGLGPTYAARLAGRWPERAALGSALDGALMLARGWTGGPAR